MVTAPIAETIPIPPISPYTPIAILPLADLPAEPELIQSLPAINPLFNIHPLEPISTTYIPKLLQQPKFSHYKHSRAKTANIHVCHKPVREFIPNAICPDIMPRFISHRSRERGHGGKRSWFTVTFNNYRIEYPYGGRSGYTKENA